MFNILQTTGTFIYTRAHTHTLFNSTETILYVFNFIYLQLLIPTTNDKKKGQQAPIFMAEPMRASNSFVGTEEYIAPVCCL
jgi:hypothetical protein